MILHLSQPLLSTMRRLFTLAVLGAFASAAQAQTLVHLYAGGENDSSAHAGGDVGQTTDGVANGTGLIVEIDGGVNYTSTTYGSDSTLAYQFSGGPGYLTTHGSPDLALDNTDSFIMELYFNTSAPTATSSLLYNGRSSGTGIGLYLYDGKLSVLRGGVAINETATINANTWYYAALVYDNGVGSVYVNGTPYAVDFSSGFGELLDGSLTIGASSSGNDHYTGIIDNVRISTFSPGTFNASMLSYTAVPEPATYAALFGLAVLGVALGRRRWRRA